MPTIFRHDGFRCFFYPNECDPREPVHVHVRKGDGEAKFWVEPEISLALSAGLDSRTLRMLGRVIRAVPTGSRMPGMTVSAESVRFDEDCMWVALSDGRTIGVPLVWFPRLLAASPDQRAAVEISPMGLHWEALDEDISVAALLDGKGDQTRSGAHAA